MKKIIQIQLIQSSVGTRVVALCDDGTIWMLDVGDTTWSQLPAIK